MYIYIYTYIYIYVCVCVHLFIYLFMYLFIHSYSGDFGDSPAQNVWANMVCMIPTYSIKLPKTESAGMGDIQARSCQPNGARTASKSAGKWMKLTHMFDRKTGTCL